MLAYVFYGEIVVSNETTMIENISDNLL